MGFFDYVQLVSLAFWVFVFIGRTLYLRLVKDIRPITLGIGKQGLNALLEISFLVGLTVWCIEVLLYALPTDAHLFPWPLDIVILDHGIAKAVGAVLVLLGVGLFIWALASFGRSWRVGIDQQSPGQLVTHGAFAFSRNPIFVFVDFYFIGTFLLNGTVFFLLSAVLVVVGLHYQILQEEQFLRQQYGEAYTAYRARTRRYVGRRG
jgi:protein-S-isoprenylcysteine O-methyltransferase Ste14